MNDAMLNDLLKTAEVQGRLPDSVKEAHAHRDLNSLVVHRMRGEGIKVAGDLVMTDILKALGTKIYTKNAEWRMVRLGLDALENL